MKTIPGTTAAVYNYDVLPRLQALLLHQLLARLCVHTRIHTHEQASPLVLPRHEDGGRAAQAANAPFALRLLPSRHEHCVRLDLSREDHHEQVRRHGSSPSSCYCFSC